MELSVAQPAPGQDFQIAVHLEIGTGWHINANPASNTVLLPTSLTVNADLPLAVHRIDYPVSTPLYAAALDETLDVYLDRVTLRADVQVQPQTPPGQQGQLRLLVQYQACDDTRCLPPAEVIETVQLKVAVLTGAR